MSRQRKPLPGQPDGNARQISRQTPEAVMILFDPTTVSL